MLKASINTNQLCGNLSDRPNFRTEPSRYVINTLSCYTNQFKSSFVAPLNLKEEVTSCHFKISTFCHNTFYNSSQTHPEKYS